MSVMISKAKLIAALKKRRIEVSKRHKTRQAEYKAAEKAYRTKALAKVTDVARRIRAAKKVDEVRELLREECYVSRPKTLPRPDTKAIDKALLELELLDDATLTIESNKQYLAILSGEEDYNNDPDDEDYDDEG